ncbi:UDP-glucose/GDP-mannose dehydrogenase family protein [Candidatus Woesearchaeota archaeon]|nr:MAG: UDP-glucose/GDP-mannose dehydrogenase family protein [Candidatus Woesearchaeota archaeon]
MLKSKEPSHHNMNILVVGTGFVGATHAAVMAHTGHKVLAYDIDSQKIDAFNSRDAQAIDSQIYERGLAKLIQDHKSNLSFTSKLADVTSIRDQLDAIFLCLPTPAQELEKPFDERYLARAAYSIEPILSLRSKTKQENRLIILNKSTVPIGTAKTLEDRLRERGLDNFAVGSNPEFLVEGKAVQGSLNPDRIVVGLRDEKDIEKAKRIYKNHEGKIITMSPESAESVKLLANFELYSRIVQTYHVAGRLCESNPNLNYEDIIAGVTADARIPKWGHYLSLYAGGSCFDKDARNLLKTIEECAASEHAQNFINTTIEGNKAQLKRLYHRAKETGFNFKGKTVALMGTAFKCNTNDVRMSPAIPLTKWLIRDGAFVLAYDPQASNNYLKAFEGAPESAYLSKCSKKEALELSDCTIICTEWPEFKFLAEDIRENCKTPYLILDGRRAIAKEYENLSREGYSIIAVGAPQMGPCF